MKDLIDSGEMILLLENCNLIAKKNCALFCSRSRRKSSKTSLRTCSLVMLLEELTCSSNLKLINLNKKNY